jgi:hypothetical protein
MVHVIAFCRIILLIIGIGCNNGNVKHVAKEPKSLPLDSQSQVYPKLSKFNADSIPQLIYVTRSEISDSNNINILSIEFRESTTGSIFKRINLLEDNPFLKSGLKIIPNEFPADFYFLEIPGDGTKSRLKKFYNPIVYDLIPEKVAFEKILYKFSINETASNNFVTIFHTLDLDNFYDERSGVGYLTTILKVFKFDGTLYFETRVDGGEDKSPLVTADGKYLVYLRIIDPYGNQEQRSEF